MGKELVYSDSSNIGSTKTKILIKNNSTLFIVSYSAQIDQFEKPLKDFHIIINTF